MAPNRGRPKPAFKSSKPASRKTATGPKRKPGSGGAKRKVTGPLKKEVRKNAATQAKAPKKPKKRTYTDEELGLPKLNKITPAGVQKPKGMKKGKVFVDDPESMLTILAMVNAEKEGQHESQMIKARQMEEIREARRKEHERKEEIKKAKLEEVKDGFRRKRRRRKNEDLPAVSSNEVKNDTEEAPRKKKRVSFA